MKKQMLILFLITISALVDAQTAATKYANRFFKSYEDYIAGKPVEEATVASWKANSVEVKTKGAQEKVKISKLPYSWFVNEGGMLMRVFDGDLYYVVIDGPISYYIKSDEGTAGFASDGYHLHGKFTDSFPSDYYSETPNGKIAKLSGKKLGVYLKKYDLEKQYNKDPEFKREMRDCVQCWQSKKAHKKIKYIKLVNEKMK
ncbi:MAG: hypothetical protein K0S33_3615 [Bacteroidetes bacterium]|jgi:hypothetical protein|nr:hypothetical protein [Bacteroidota bacterium]